MLPVRTVGTDTAEPECSRDTARHPMPSAAGFLVEESPQTMRQGPLQEVTGAWEEGEAAVGVPGRAPWHVWGLQGGHCVQVRSLGSEGIGEGTGVTAGCGQRGKTWVSPQGG